MIAKFLAKEDDEEKKLFEGGLVGQFEKMKCHERLHD